MESSSAIYKAWLKSLYEITVEGLSFTRAATAFSSVFAGAPPGAATPKRSQDVLIAALVVVACWVSVAAAAGSAAVETGAKLTENDTLAVTRPTVAVTGRMLVVVSGTLRSTLTVPFAQV